jgi:hypothetical protein
VDVIGDGLAGFFEVVLPHLNEVHRRVVAGAMATALGRGGKTVVVLGPCRRQVGSGYDPDIDPATNCRFSRRERTCDPIAE